MQMSPAVVSGTSAQGNKTVLTAHVSVFEGIVAVRDSLYIRLVADQIRDIRPAARAGAIDQN